MQTRAPLLCCLFLSLATLACSSSSSQVATPASEAASARATGAGADTATPTGPVLGQVAFQNHRVAIHSSAEGPRYTLLDGSGIALAEALSEQQFQNQFPELFQAFETASAQRLDASAIDASRPGFARPQPGQSTFDR